MIVTVVEPGLLEVSGLSAPQIGETAAAHGIVLHELMPQQVSLEEAFMDLTRDDVEFKHGLWGHRHRGCGMSATTIVKLPPLAVHGRVTQARVAVSEWTKLWSVRSTRWSLFAAFLFTIGVAALACAVVSHHYPQMSPQDKANFHPLEVNLAGVQLAQLALGVLGVLIITAEYSTGMIRASFTAVPKRLPVLWAKAGVFGVGHVRVDASRRPHRVLRRRGDPRRPPHRHRRSRRRTSRACSSVRRST